MPVYRITTSEKNQLTYGWDFVPAVPKPIVLRWNAFQLAGGDVSVKIPNNIKLYNVPGCGGDVPHAFGTNSGPFVVSKELQNFINEFEPNIHDWHAVKIESDIPTFGKEYYMWRLTLELNTRVSPTPPARHDEKLRVGHLVWREKLGGIYCAKYFKDKIIESQFSEHLSFYEMLE